MTLRSSSGRPDSAGNIFRYTLEQFRAILLFYAILMALLGPLSLLVQHWTDTGANGLGRSPNLLGWGLPLVMAVLLPLLIFSYVNNKQALDVFHAAPVRRGSLYLGRYLGGTGPGAAAPGGFRGLLRSGGAALFRQRPPEPAVAPQRFGQRLCQLQRHGFRHDQLRDHV